MSARALGLCLWLLVGCGSAPAERGTTEAHLPDTAWDPAPYTPAPTEHPTTDRPTGIVVSSGYERARHTVLSLVLAIRDADGPRLEELLGDPVTSLTPQLSTTPLPRDRLVQRILNHPRRGGLASDIPLERLVDPAGFAVAPLARLFPDQNLPEGLRPDDVRVLIPLRSDGLRLLGAVIGWRTHVAAIVRPGPDPRILAL